VIAVLHGSNVLCVLRPVQDGDRYRFVGQCYVQKAIYGRLVLGMSTNFVACLNLSSKVW